MYALKQKNIDIKIIEKLILKGAKINSDADIRTAILKTYETENLQAIKLLIRNGIIHPSKFIEFSPDYKTLKHGIPSLNSLIANFTKNGDIDLVNLFFKSGYLPSDYYKKNVLLKFAVISKNYELVKLLLEKGIDPSQDREALKAAMKNPQPDVFKLLLERGSDPNRLHHTTSKEYNYGFRHIIYKLNKENRAPIIDAIIPKLNKMNLINLLTVTSSNDYLNTENRKQINKELKRRINTKDCPISIKLITFMSSHRLTRGIAKYLTGLSYLFSSNYRSELYTLPPEELVLDAQAIEVNTTERLDTSKLQSELVSDSQDSASMILEKISDTDVPDTIKSQTKKEISLDEEESVVEEKSGQRGQVPFTNYDKLKIKPSNLLYHYDFLNIYHRNISHLIYLIKKLKTSAIQPNIVGRD